MEIKVLQNINLSVTIKNGYYYKSWTHSQRTKNKKVIYNEFNSNSRINLK